MQTNVRPGVRDLFILFFAIVFIYMAFGVFFEHQIGKWFSTLWYVAGLAGAAYFAYIKLSKKEETPKIVDAEVIVYERK